VITKFGCLCLHISKEQSKDKPIDKQENDDIVSKFVIET
jgi:hypothetical protein